MELNIRLTGEIFVPHDLRDPSNNVFKGGYRLKGEIYDLGSWRIHPNLHGYIVKNFANNEDNSYPINLNSGRLQETIEAIEGDHIPGTEMFFSSTNQNADNEKREAVAKLKRALEWLHVDQRNRIIFYQF
ncbi:MAG: hypothetical protein EOP04_20875 [Proteobacteria bacterium]|nr:MAG: hypothetical protein EOP04_20875 [Pseudomonadota bacterium]